MENNDYQDVRFLLNEHAQQIIEATAPHSLRDGFAMAAIAGLLASEPLQEWQDAGFFGWAAKAAYLCADAMMKERMPPALPSEPEGAPV